MILETSIHESGAAIRQRRRWIDTVVAVLLVTGWASLIGWSSWWGRHIHDRARLQLGNTPPLLGARRFEAGQLWPSIAIAVAVMLLLPHAKKLEFRRLVLIGWLTAAAWTTSVAISDGWRALAAPMRRANEYGAALPALHNDPLRFIRDYTSNLPSYPTQVKGHPPLPVLVLWAWQRIGFHGPGWSAALVITVGTSSVVAAAVTVKSLTSPEQARRLVPFLVLAPATAWLATSMDAFFTGVAAWGVALSVMAAQRPRRLPAVLFGLGAGVLLGSLPYLSYGLLPFAAIALAAFVAARRAAPAAVPAAFTLPAILLGAVAVAGAFTAGGFWWPAGVRATHHLYVHTYGSGSRPYLYFLIADLAVVAIMTGPAAVVALGRPGRGRELNLILAAALLAVVVSDISGYTRGEVERIWLPYAPWLLLAPANLQPRRTTLAIQIAVALAVQSLVLSPW